MVSVSAKELDSRMAVEAISGKQDLMYSVTDPRRKSDQPSGRQQNQDHLQHKN